MERRALGSRVGYRAGIAVTLTSWAAALLQPLCKRALGMAAIATAAISSVPAAAYPTQSWNGYHWARTGELSIALGDNLSSTWKPFFTTAATQWSAADNIDFAPTIGSTSASTCGAVYGSVQVCSGNYGANGWLGYASVWTGGGFIVQATVKLNDYYFSQAKYNTSAWRAMTACQEIGHTLGLAHNDTIKTDLNKGTCMDYTNDPTGTYSAVNGYLANTAPASSDFAALNGIYATVDASQLSYTKPQYRVADALSVGDDHESAVQALPEPGTWLLMLAGFGGIGIIMRRRNGLAVNLSAASIA